MNVIELRGDGVGAIVVKMLIPNNMDVVIADMAFLVDLLRVLQVIWHHRGNMEDAFEIVCRVEWSISPSREIWIEAPHETRMVAKVNWPAK